MNRPNHALAPAASILLVLLTLLVAPAPSARGATGPYTLPFFHPSYVVTQPYGCTGYGAEPAYGSCAHWHAGIDYNLAYAPVASTRAGTVARLLEAVPHDSHDDPRGGNYVLLSHGGSRYTLYYHLDAYGVIPGLNASVSAGQHIARSGNTGNSSGPHLHYALTTSVDWWLASNVINPAGQWTTDPGRVPWLATYYSESNGGTEYIAQNSTRTHWVKFRNAGGRTWTHGNDAYGRGRIFLAATTSNGAQTRSSAFQASDWANDWNASALEENTVPPGGVGTFSFGLRAAVPLGTYYENFNLRANALWWFDYRSIGQFYVPIQVISSGSCSRCV